MRRIALVVAIGLMSLGTCAPLGASPALPAALSPAAATKAVHDAATLSALSSQQRGPLSAAETDVVGKYYKGLAIGCYWLKDPCVFGSTTAKKSLVLFGDSHAGMWAPALIPAATAAGYRVYVVWWPNCPVADYVPYVGHLGKLAPECAAWRTLRLSQIAQLRPTIVVFSESTTFALSAANVPVLAPEWQTNLERSISTVTDPATKVVVLGDIPYFSVPPAICLAQHLSDVQSCKTAVVNALPANRQLTDAEAAAAAGAHAAFVNLDQWLCSTATSCSPFIAGGVAYSDSDHIAASYAAKLRSVVWSAILAAKP
jgi:hypothetical protein